MCKTCVKYLKILNKKNIIKNKKIFLSLKIGKLKNKMANIK
jgi:hypothetical protein